MLGTVLPDHILQQVDSYILQTLNKRWHSIYEKGLNVFVGTMLLCVYESLLPCCVRNMRSFKEIYVIEVLLT